MKKRFPSLDGWRGISILLVLAGHLLPLGPKSWQMNYAVPATGMVLFFNLSGFLIISILLRNPNIPSFLIRRFMRIIPLAWLVLLVSLWCSTAEWSLYLPNFFFYANWEPMALSPVASHFWSLCVEMQFYVSMAFLFVIFKKAAFWLLPLFSVAVTAYRYLDGVGMAIHTYYRIDEILAGCILALLYSSNRKYVHRFFCFLNPLCLFPLLVLSAHPVGGDLLYFRPYIAMLLIGSTLFNQEQSYLNRALNSNVLFYLATISYALYVLHGGLRHTWLGDGDTFERYIKRPLLLGVTFLLAHISTFYYEKYWINFGKRITDRKV